MRFVLGILLALFATEASARIEIFNEIINGTWKANGARPDGNNDGVLSFPICTVWGRFDDGSDLQISKNVKSGELYMWVRNTDWELDSEAKSNESRYSQVQINFYKGRKFVKGGALHWYAKSKNIVAIPDIGPTEFALALHHSNRLSIVMPGNIGNMHVNIPGKQVLTVLVKCIHEHGKYKKLKSPEEVPTPEVNIPHRKHPDRHQNDQPKDDGLMYGKEKI